jgi:L-lactate dehydrogenase complex protein LldE
MQPRSLTPRPAHVYLFGTCLVDLFVPQAGVDAVRLLEREGLVVHFPPAQSCCGQPAYTSGNPDEARAVARAQLALFEHDWPIVVPSGSCAGMMREHWPKLFDDEPATQARARAVGERVHELAQFLVEVLHVDYSQADASPVTVGLHTSCSARREMGTRTHGVALLAALPGVSLETHANESECCGFGGVFSLKHADISGAMVRDKVAALEGVAPCFVTADCGCLLNITHAAQHRQRALAGEHIATFVMRRLEAGA